MPSRPAAAAWLAALSATFHAHRNIGRAWAGLKLDIPILTLFAFTPAALLITMLPISLGGWGVRELTFVYFLGTAG